MATLYQFKEYLEQKKNYEIPRLLFNYMNCFYDSHHQEFQDELIEHFFFYSLYDLHYRTMRASFNYHLMDEIQPFFRKHHLNIDPLKKNLNAQIIAIEKTEDLLDTLKTYYQNDHYSVRTLPCQSPMALALQLRSDGSLRVYMHNDLCLLQDGKLKPFPPLSHLYYNSQFELEPLKSQMVYGSYDHFYIFSAEELEIKNFSKNFSLLEKIKVSSIQKHPHLFLSLKRLEAYYIKAKTDSFYQELIQSLQIGYQLLIENHPQAFERAEKCMDQAQMALRNIYPQDRLLLLLTANIEYRLKGPLQNTLEKTNLS